MQHAEIIKLIDFATDNIPKAISFLFNLDITYSIPSYLSLIYQVNKVNLDYSLFTKDVGLYLVETYEQLNGKKHDDNYYRQLSNCYFVYAMLILHCDEYIGSINYFKKAISTLNNIVPKTEEINSLSDHYYKTLIYAHNRYGVYLHDRDDYLQAIDRHKIAVENHENFKYKNPQNMVYLDLCYRNLALAYIKSGFVFYKDKKNYIQAIEMYKSAVECWNKITIKHP